VRPMARRTNGRIEALIVNYLFESPPPMTCVVRADRRSQFRPFHARSGRRAWAGALAPKGLLPSAVSGNLGLPDAGSRYGLPSNEIDDTSGLIDQVSAVG
jgi:hypothetical protein